MNLLQHACRTCNFPRLMPRSGRYEYQYAGELVCIETIEFCHCHRCGSETVLPEQHERNCERITNANLEALASKWAQTRPVVLRADALALATGLPHGTAQAAGPGANDPGVNDARYPVSRLAWA